MMSSFTASKYASNHLSRPTGGVQWESDFFGIVSSSSLSSLSASYSYSFAMVGLLSWWLYTVLFDSHEFEEAGRASELRVYLSYVSMTNIENIMFPIRKNMVIFLSTTYIDDTNELVTVACLQNCRLINVQKVCFHIEANLLTKKKPTFWPNIYQI